MDPAREQQPIGPLMEQNRVKEAYLDTASNQEGV